MMETDNFAPVHSILAAAKSLVEIKGELRQKDRFKEGWDSKKLVDANKHLAIKNKQRTVAKLSEKQLVPTNVTRGIVRPVSAVSIPSPDARAKTSAQMRWAKLQKAVLVPTDPDRVDFPSLKITTGVRQARTLQRAAAAAAAPAPGSLGPAATWGGGSADFVDTVMPRRAMPHEGPPEPAVARRTKHKAWPHDPKPISDRGDWVVAGGPQTAVETRRPAPQTADRLFHQLNLPDDRPAWDDRHHTARGPEREGVPSDARLVQTARELWRADDWREAQAAAAAAAGVGGGGGGGPASPPTPIAGYNDGTRASLATAPAPDPERAAAAAGMPGSLLLDVGELADVPGELGGYESYGSAASAGSHRSLRSGQRTVDSAASRPSYAHRGEGYGWSQEEGSGGGGGGPASPHSWHAPGRPQPPRQPSQQTHATHTGAALGWRSGAEDPPPAGGRPSGMNSTWGQSEFRDSGAAPRSPEEKEDLRNTLLMQRVSQRHIEAVLGEPVPHNHRARPSSSPPRSPAAAAAGAAAAARRRRPAGSAGPVHAAARPGAVGGRGEPPPPAAAAAAAAAQPPSRPRGPSPTQLNASPRAQGRGRTLTAGSRASAAAPPPAPAAAAALPGALPGAPPGAALQTSASFSPLRNRQYTEAPAAPGLRKQASWHAGDGAGGGGGAGAPLSPSPPVRGDQFNASWTAGGPAPPGARPGSPGRLAPLSGGGGGGGSGVGGAGGPPPLTPATRDFEAWRREVATPFEQAMANRAAASAERLDLVNRNLLPLRPPAGGAAGGGGGGGGARRRKKRGGGRRRAAGHKLRLRVDAAMLNNPAAAAAGGLPRLGAPGGDAAARAAAVVQPSGPQRGGGGGGGAFPELVPLPVLEAKEFGLSPKEQLQLRQLRLTGKSRVKFSYLYGSQNPHNIPVTARKAAKRNKSAARQAQRRASEARYWAGRELEYRHRRQAVVLVQAAWRGHLTRRLIFPWLHLRWTALTAIQAAWRGHVARRRAARLRWLRARHWGAVTIQRVFRGMRARQALADQRRLEALRRQQESPAVVLVAKETRALLSAHVEDLDAPAVALQCAWRGFLARDDALARWWGLHVLQRAWRCHAARRALGAARAEREGREAAALRLQGLARQRSARGEAAARRARREAAVRLQCAQRGRSARGEAAARRARREAAVALQCAHRGRAARGEAAARRARRAAEAAAAGRLQRCERGRRARARLARRHAAAARLQCLARRRAAARELRRRRGERAVAERAARRRAAAVALQCAWRGAAARWRAGRRRRERALRAAKARLRGEREAAATAIQAAWRGHRARARLQAAVRAARERAARELAAGRLQAAERGRQGRRRAAQRRRQRERHTRRQEAAVALQCAHRGRAARGEAAARRARREAEAAAATAIQAQHRRRAAAAAAGARRAEARRAAAATRIQAAQRQRAAAAAVGARRRQRDEGRAATAIQAAARARAARGEAAKRRSMAGHELRAYQARRAAERIAEERGRIAAATRLQARHRGNAARAEVALMRWSNAERRAALAIQCAVRQRQARARAGARREARARAAAALALQCAQRARAARAAAGARRARRRREERERAAAAAVQAAWRGHRARRRRRALEHRTIRLAQRYTRDLRRLAREDGATRLQALWRGHRVRRLGRLRRLRRLAREGAAATRITAAARGRVVRNGRPLDRQRRAQAARARARREEGAATAIQAAQRGRAARGEAAARRRRAREEAARRRAREEAAAATAIAAAARGRLARRALPGRRARAAELAAARQHALRRQASGAKLRVRRQERLGERARRDRLARAVQRGWRAHWARRGPDVYAARAEAARRAQQEEQRERTRGRLAHRKAERLRRQHSAARIQRGYRAHAARQGAAAAEEEALARAMAAQWVLVEFGERGVRDSLVSLRARDQAAAELAAAKAAEVEAAARAEDLVEAACARAASRQKEREVVKEELLREKTRSFNIFGLNVDMPLFRDPSVLSLDTIVNGTEVLVDFLSSGDYRPATILRQHHDGSYDVIYHHGAKEVRVPKRRVAEMEPEIDYLAAEPVQDQRMQSCLTQKAASASGLTYSQASSSTDLLSELHYPPCHTRNGSLQPPRPGEDPSIPPPLGPAPAHMAAPASRLPPVAPLAAFPEEKKYRCAMSTARHTRLLVAVVERPAARVMEVRALAPAGAAPVAVRASLRPADFAAAGVPYDPFAPGAGRESKLDACHLALLHREMAELALDWAGALAVGGRRFFCRVRERPGAEEFRVKYCDATAERAGELALPYAEVRARGCRGDPLLLPREDKLRACHTWLCEALLMGKLAALRGRLSEQVSLAGGDAQAEADWDEDGDGEGKGAEAEELRREEAAAAAAAAGPLPAREARGDRWPTDLSSVTGQDLQAAGSAAERLETLGLLYAAAARGGGPRDLSAFPPAALAQLKRALPEVGATGDLLALPVPGRGEGAPPVVPMRLVRAGERLALAPGDEAVYVPFEPWRGPGQQVELAGPGGQTLRLVYDEVMDEVRLDGAGAGVGVGDEVELFPGLWCEVHRGSFIFRFIAGPLRAAAVGAKEVPAAAATGEEPAAPLSPVEEEGEDPEAPPGDALRSTAKRRPSGGEAPGPGPAKKRQTTDLSGAAFDSAGAVQGRADAAAGQEDATLAPSLTDEFDQMSLVPEDEMAMILGKAFGKADDGAALEDQPFFTVEAAGVGDEAALPPPVPSAPGLEVLPKTNLMPTREKQEDESTVASALPGPELAQREKFESRRILRCGSSSKSLVSPKIKREPQRDLNSSSPPPPSSTGCGEGGNQSCEAVAVPAAAMKERCSPDEGATRLRRESAAATRINAAARGHVVRSGRPLEARAQARREAGAATTIQTAQRARTAREEAAARRHQAQEEAAAATRINAAARGHVVRSGCPLEARAQARREASAATTIQTAQRARTAREEAAARRQRAQEEAAAATRINAAARGHVLRSGRPLEARAQARREAGAATTIQTAQRARTAREEAAVRRQQAQEEAVAATRINAAARGHVVRSGRPLEVRAQVRREAGAATTIQTAQRARTAREEAAARRHQAQEEAAAATRINAAARGHVVRSGRPLEARAQARREAGAATTIQTAQRARTAREEAAARRQRAQEEAAAATRINAAARGHVVRSGRPLEARAQARREAGAATTIQTAQRARTAREEAAARRQQAQEEAARLRAEREAAEALARAMAAQWLRVQFGEHCVRNSLVSLLAGDQAAAELAAAREAEAEAAARAEELVESACVWAHVRRQEGAATTIQAAQRGRIARGEAAARRRWAQEEASRQRAGRAAAEALAGAVAAQWLRAQLGEHCARVGLTSLWAGERAAAELAAARAAEAAAAARAEELVEAACAWAASRQTERQVASEALVRTVTRSFKILGEDVEISLLRDASQSSLGSTSTKTEVNNGAVAGTSLLECEPLSVSADYAIAGTAHTVCGASVLECEKVAHSRATSIAAAAGVSLLECEPLSVSADYAIAGTAHTVSGASLLECGKVAHDQATSIVAVAGVSLLECEPLPASANHAIMHQETSLLLAFDVEEVSEGDQAAAIVAAEEQCSQPEVSEPETLMKAARLPPSQPLTHDSNLAVTHASHITSGVSNMQCAEVTASRPSHTPDMGPLLVSGNHAITHTSHIVAGVERLVCASIFQKDCDQASSGEAAASFEVEEPDQGDQSAILPSETEVVLEPKLAKLLDARAYEAATDVVTQAELLDAEASKAAMNVVAQNRANVPAAPVTWPATAGVSRLGCPSLMPLNGSADEISSMSNTVDFAQAAMLEAKAKKASSKIKGGDFVPPRWAAAPCPEAGEVHLVVAGRTGGGGGAPRTVVALTPLLRAAGGGPVFVGRARQHSAVVVKHASVGRRHAALVSGPTGQVFLRDLGDAAGGAPRTRVNGRPAAGLRPLRDGDRVELGAAPGRCTVEAAPPAPLPAAPRGPVGALAHLGGGAARPAARLAPLKTTKQQRQEELKLWSFLEDLEPRGAPAALASSDGGSVASMQKCSSQIGDIMASYDTLLEDQRLEGETAHLLRSMDWEAERQGHLDRALGALAEAVGGKKEQAKHRLGALRAFMKGASRRGSLARKAQRRAAQHTHAAQPARAVFPLAEVSPVVCRVAPQGPVGALAHAASAVAARRLDVRAVPATGSWSPQRDAEAAAQVEARLAQRVAWEAERAAGLEGALRRFEAGLSAKTERAGLKLHAMNLFLHHGPALPAAAAAAAPVGPPKDAGSLPSTAADSSLGGARPERPALGAAAAAAGPAGGGGGGGGAAALRAEQERLWRLEARLRYLEGALREGARAAAARLGAAQAFLEAARAEVAERRAAAVARAPLLPAVGEEGAAAAEEEEERAKDAAVAEAFRLGRALEALGAEGRLAAALGARLGQLDRGLGVKLARCGARVQSLRRLRAALEAAALPSEEGGGGGRGGRRGRRGALGDYARDAAAAGGGAGRVSRMPSNASALSGAGGGDALSVVSELTTPAALAADDASVVTQQGEGLAAELGAEKARLGALAAKVAEYLLALQTRVRRDPVAANTAAARAFLASAGPRPAAAAAAGLASFGPQHRVAGAVAVAAPPLAPVPRGGGGGGQAAAAGGGGPGEGAAAVGDRAAWLGARLATLEEEMAPGLVGAGRVLRRAEACLEGSRVELVQRQAVAAFGGGSGGGGLEGRATARLVEEERWRLAELQRMLARFKAQVREKHSKAAAKLAALREINAALRAADELKDDASAASLASQAASVAAASRLTQDAMHTVALLEAERARCAALEERVARFERTLRAKLEGAAVPLAAVAAFARPGAADEGGDPEAQAAALNGEAEASLASAGRRLSAASHLLGDASLELERRRLPGGGGGGADAAGREHEEYLRGVLAEERERVAALGRMMAQVEASLAEKRERARAKLAAVRQLRWKGGGEGEGEGGAQEGRSQGQGESESEGTSCRRPSEGTVRTLALLEAEQERAADLEARVAAFEEAMQARLQGTTVKLAAVAAFSAARAEEAASSSAPAKAKAAAAAAGGDARSPAERRLERASGRVAARLARAARRLSAASRHLDQAEAANSGGGGGGDAASSLGGGGGGSGGSGGGSEGGQSDEGARSRATAELVAAQRAKAAELEAMMARLEAAVAEKRGRARAKLAAAAALGAKGARAGAGGAAAAALPAEEAGGAPLAEERERAAALEVRATVFEKVVKAKVKISAMTSAGKNILE